MAKVIMVQGTMSNAGKSLVAAGLCRVFRQDGYRVAPFKSQNMALNSYITKEGLEMGRAQVVQAEAAGIEPQVCMNPILLKPTNDIGSQVIVNGEVLGNMPAREYFKYKTKLIPDIMKAYRKLEEQADIIVVEGAGSPAEINLRDNDIVNMGLAEMLDAPVILVGDIDRGGVFAQLLGTIMLVSDDERARIKGLVINKFRGDKTILDPGVEMLTERAEIPVVGVLPYIRVSIDDEDSLSGRLTSSQKGMINIVVIRLPRLSNFTDFSAFEQVEGVKVIYTDKPQEIENADMVILPGSKNTIDDLRWLRESGLEAAIKKYSKTGIVFGVCGGYQMLGNTVNDPYGVEGGGKIRGLELIDMETTLKKEKIRTRIRAQVKGAGGALSKINGCMVDGYEIHMGESIVGGKNGTFIEKVISQNGQDHIEKGISAWNGNVYGTYIHGIFDSGGIAHRIIDVLAERKGVSLGKNEDAPDYRQFKEMQYDILADMIRENMDMEAIYKMMGMR